MTSWQSTPLKFSHLSVHLILGGDTIVMSPGPCSTGSESSCRNSNRKCLPCHSPLLIPIHPVNFPTQEPLCLFHLSLHPTFCNYVVMVQLPNNPLSTTVPHTLITYLHLICMAPSFMINIWCYQNVFSILQILFHGLLAFEKHHRNVPSPS